MASGGEIKFDFVRMVADHTGTNVAVGKIEHLASGFAAYAYQCRLEEDFDGAPRAYGLDNPHPIDPAHNPDTQLQHDLDPFDHLGNATMPHQNFEAGSNTFVWVGLYAATEAFAAAHRFSLDRRPRVEARGMVVGKTVVPLPPGRPGMFPAIQGTDAPAPGYYVSTSSVVADRARNAWDQQRYVDASEIPYAAWAWWWKSLKVSQGDFGVAIRPDNGRMSGFVFGDAGTSKVGEVSNKLMETLSPGEGRGTRNEHPTLFLVFPQSGGGILGQLSTASNALLQARVLMQIRRLNALPDNGRIPLFLAMGADTRKYTGFQAGRPVGGTYLFRYRTIEQALKNVGFVAASHYEMVL